MNINRDNCEAYFLDFYEGRLSAEEAEQLFAFLDQHPDLREIFDSYDDAGLDPILDQINFPAKDELRRMADLPASINEINCDDFFIASVEGTLDENQEKELEKFLAENPSLRKDFDLFRQTRLAPETIVFEDKDSLRRHSFAVTADNAEEMMIASVEGLLDAAQQKSLDEFIAAHPSYSEIFAQYQQTRLTAEPVVFEFKDSLRRTAVAVDASNAEEMMIASVEGLLNTSEQQALDVFLASSPAHAAEYALFRKTILQPETIVFADKDSLRRDKAVVVFWWRYAAAAAVLLLFGLFWFNRGDVSVSGIKQDNGIAGNGTLHQLKIDQGKGQRKQGDENNSVDIRSTGNQNNSSRGNEPQLVQQPVREPRVIESFGSPVVPVLAFNPVIAGDVNGTTFVVNDIIDQLAFAPTGEPNEDDGSLAQTAGGWLKRRVNKTDLAADDEQSMASTRLTGWDVANWFVNGIDKLTGAGLHLKRKAAKDGTTYSLVTGKRTYSRTFRNK